MGTILDKCCCCLKGTVLSGDTQANATQQPIVSFAYHHGPHCRVSSFYVSGNGTAVANTALLQTRSYWEIKVAEKGEFYVGVARPGKNGLQLQLGDRKHSWGMYSGEGGGDFSEGDVIGVSYDLSNVKPKLSFYLNGKRLKGKSTSKARGDVHPAVSVKNGCMLEANFGPNFDYPPPQHFDAIIPPRSLI
eukprot:TRINITY_DN20630_c0_g1_i1.p1 TRINITY_DN20630_c0_g1~~TRINITY_DN20630_c0_g1_i1.p1  ORF type:complete len:190 (+),score=85.96 TRINITY_DN20630_c0_g1_i1:57-626(+)